MEALRTQVDNLQWDVNRLDAENRWLREENPDATRAVDLEAELEQLKADVARLTKRVRAYEQQTTDHDHVVVDLE